MSNLFLATVDFIPNKNYDVIGIVVGNRGASIFSKTEARKAIEKMKNDAINLGADGIIGIRINTSAKGSTTVIGTAIKFI